MSCQFCGEVLSGLVAGLVSLALFIILTVIQILFASIRLIIDKIISLKSK